MLPRADARSAHLPDPWGRTGVVALLAAYAVLHVVLRLLISPVVNIDDAREAVLGQTLEWGYQARQPPLYNWLVWITFRLFGVGVLSLTLVKYALLFTAYAFVYASGRRILADTRLAALATFSLLLIVPISWIVHEDLTHSVAALAACAATFYALVRLPAHDGWGAYIALGAALGLGMLSKFTYGVFAAALLVAGLSVEPFRARLLAPRMAVALAVAGIVVTPFTVWFLRQGYELGPLFTAEVRTRSGEPYLSSVAAGLYYIARVTVYYATPLWLVFLVLFPRAYRSGTCPTADAGAGGRLLERFHLSVLGLLMAGALGSAVAYLKFRWLMPAFFLLPLYAFSRAERSPYDDRQVRRFAAVLVIAEIAVVVGILAHVYTGSLFGRPSRFNEPYDAAARQIAAAGFTRGTMVVGGGALGGNLRLAFPDSRVISLDLPGYIPPAIGSRQCLIVWMRGGGAAVPPNVRALAASVLDARLTGEEPIRAIEAPYRFAADRIRRVYYVLLPDGAGRCR